MFIGLNPSTADATKDDPTIRRCKRFASDWGYRWLLMTNVFAIRATDPNDMKAAEMPWSAFGEEFGNNHWLREGARDAGIVVAAWGVNAEWLRGDINTKAVLAGVQFKCLGVTKSGFPRHPLYVKSSTVPVDYLWCINP